jgi:serine/threonine protein kinase
VTQAEPQSDSSSVAAAMAGPAGALTCPDFVCAELDRSSTLHILDHEESMTIGPGKLLNQYRLVEKIGEGGMGVVWKALDTTLDREAAIKILPMPSHGTPTGARDSSARHACWLL